jgi:hypothetical protein
MSDGNMLATAAGQLRTFDTSSNKNIKKFSGHSVSISCFLLPIGVPLLGQLFIDMCPLYLSTHFFIACTH